MVNFLSETKETLTDIAKTPADITYIGNISENPDNNHSCTWQDFETLADFKYAHRFGEHEIPGDLIIVFSDGSWLSREEYDESEWWNYKVPIKLPSKTKKITTFKLGGKYPNFD